MKTEGQNLQLFNLTITIAVVCTIAMLVFEPNNIGLGYNRDDFHIWQLLTAHFVHYDWQHFVTNILAMGILLYLFPTPLEVVIVGMSVAIGLIDIYLWSGEVRYYVGFSGLLYVVLGIALSKYLFKKQYMTAILIVIVLVIYTLNSKNSINISEGVLWRPLIEAHFLGFVSGLITKTRITLFKKK